MALHMREQIAAAAVTTLTGLTTTGANVFRDRDTSERPLQSTELPGLLIEDDGDPSEIVTLGTGRVLERQMALRVTAHVKATSGASAQLNLILKEVEIALSGASLAGEKWIALSGVAPREVIEAADQPSLRQAFNFTAVYFTAHNAPDVAL